MIALHLHSQRLLVIVGASGAGKDSLLHSWLASVPAELKPHRARRTITRNAGDASEDHEAIDDAGFHAAQTAGAFALSWQAHGLHYGVRRAELAPLALGRWVVMNGSRAHLHELRTAAPHARVVEVSAPEALRRARLGRRGREGAPQLHGRLLRSAPGSGLDTDADLRIVNDGDLAAAVAQLARWWQSLPPCADGLRAAPRPSPHRP